MTQRQTISGFFDDAAEARQAVQLLLAEGFAPDTLGLSTYTDLNPPATDSLSASETDSSSGRFFTSLFGNNDAARSGQETNEGQGMRRDGALVTVQAQTTTEIKMVAKLLASAGAAAVTGDERTTPSN